MDGKMNFQSLIGVRFFCSMLMLLIAACTFSDDAVAPVGDAATDSREGKKSAYARFVPEREDDFAWENDKVAFRVYGPRSSGVGPVSGVDAWFKKVSYPIIDKWYTQNQQGKSYHEDHGEGYDKYHTGTSRGVGGTAVWIDGVAYPAGKFESYTISQAGGDAVDFVLQYAWSTPLGEVEETKRITLETGSQLYQVRSRFTLNGRPGSLPIAIGLTTHDGAAEVYSNKAAGRISTWEMIDNIGVGTGAVIAANRVRDIVHEVSDKKDASHIWLVTATGTDGTLEFRAGYAWQAAGEMTSVKQWNEYLDLVSLHPSE